MTARVGDTARTTGPVHGVVSSLGRGGRLVLERDDETVLRGATPTCQGWRGAEPLPAAVTVEADERGFVVGAVAEGADAIDLRIELDSGRHWYGMGELLHQRWPLEDVALQRTPFMTWDNGISGFGNLLEPVWFTATGVGLWVGPDDPQIASVTLNEPPRGAAPDWAPTLDVRSPKDQRPYAADAVGGDGLLVIRVAGDRMRARILAGTGIRDVHRAFIELAGRPAAPPPARAMTLPTWTTWARYKVGIDQRRCLDFVDEIERAQFPIGTLEIDDKWQVEYGELAFDPDRFPDPRGMIETIHARGIEVTSWVVPFVDPRAVSAEEAVRERLVVRRPDGGPYLVTWWHDPGYLLDFSEARAVAWFADHLERLRSATGLDGFKFDAGEGCYLPADAVTAEGITPNEYSHRYAEFVGRLFPGSDVRTAWRNQRSTAMFRQWDKDSAWGLGNGLQAMLTQTLTFGLIGYPFVLPDMIGGNAFGEQQPDAELLVRWTQANALLPVMQFSVAPWDFGAEATELARRATDLHVAFGPELERLAAEAVATGLPIVRPLVLEFPADPTTETIWDQFMLGDRWLVAPVVDGGARARDIYLPEGAWRDELGTVHHGPVWLPAAPAPLERLPYFERVDAPR